MAKFLIINGPNINMLGQRDPSIYGTKTFADENFERKHTEAGLLSMAVRTTSYPPSPNRAHAHHQATPCEIVN